MPGAGNYDPVLAPLTAIVVHVTRPGKRADELLAAVATHLGRDTQSPDERGHTRILEEPSDAAWQRVHEALDAAGDQFRRRPSDRRKLATGSENEMRAPPDSVNEAFPPRLAILHMTPSRSSTNASVTFGSFRLERITLSRMQQVIDALEAERADVQERLMWLDRQIEEFRERHGDGRPMPPQRSVRRGTARRASTRRATARQRTGDIEGRIIDYLSDHPESTAGDVAKGLNANPNTTATRLSRMVKTGDITKASKGYVAK